MNQFINELLAERLGRGSINESLKNEIAAARQEVNRDPSEGQKHAGNYKMGHVRVNGYDISLENPKGSYRRGTDPDGKKWSCKMYHDYGYFRSTKGKDGDAIDVFIGDDYDSRKIFVIDQIIKGKFDESKVMFCFPDEKSAMEGYLANYEKGWSAGKHITEVSDDIFREWLYDGYKQRKPFYQYVQIKQNKLNESWAPGIPKVCPKCGSKVGLYIKGEPVYLCSNKDCREYFGTMPFPNHNRKVVAENIVRKILRENEEWRNRVLDRLQNAGSSRLFACFKAINPDATCNLDVYSFNDWLRDPRTRSLITDDEVATIEKTLDKLGDKGNPGGMIRYDEIRAAKMFNEPISRSNQSVQGKRTITVSESQVRELSKRIDKRKEIINKLAQMTLLQQIELIKRLCGAITDPVGVATSFYNKLQAGVNGDYARSFTTEEFEQLETIL